MNTRAPDPARSSREIVSVNPAMMEELGRVPIFSDTEINDALAKARIERRRGGQSQWKPDDLVAR